MVHLNVCACMHTCKNTHIIMVSQLRNLKILELIEIIYEIWRFISVHTPKILILITNTNGNCEID